ncbi:MAG: hypothetical protein HY785_00345 [Oscillatoriophycideae cyanobacterium NC_groundwater_1537_Pr4_S-0.65um_50_18]|nr:hypothetical protein [Oscillatoriophycideae cyanobacterium NC_groundwater_1537_Pr4_S-0.65um_50_18]
MGATQHAWRSLYPTHRSRHFSDEKPNHISFACLSSEIAILIAQGKMEGQSYN